MRAVSQPSVLWSLILGTDVLILDRLHKYIQIDVFGWTGGEVVPITSFFDYILVWNTGISYGLLGGLTPEMLLIVMGVAVVALAFWWAKDDGLLTRVGIALAIGGALSNAIDRIVYGAVADFFHFHVGNFSWYVFNIADVAITFGVVLLVADVLWPRRKVEADS
ncbi:signal peptidase II [Pelagibacterium xiamenense]|uniref:signal peptidase II n=1 Tax=Pelagibacterium xiamenense TaxID=2901140 RepID=UPI001E606B87|nr:signal peptidase II [Pelagibacterium xiamenense]MCD7059214.1 signal peptidase II [Pelagibacterium xiamenense]